MADLKLVGAVAIKVRPDARKFREELDRDLKREMAGYEYKVEAKAEVKLDKAKAKADAKKLEKDLENTEINWSVKIDRDSVRAAKKQFEKLIIPTETVKIEFETDDEIEKTRAKLKEMADAAKVHLTYVQDEKGYQSVLDKIAAIRREKLEIDIEFNTDEEMDKLEAEMRERLGKNGVDATPLVQQITLRYNEDRPGLEKAISTIEAELAKLDEVEINVDLDRAALTTKLHELRTELKAQPFIVKFTPDEAGYQDVLNKIRSLQRQRAEIEIDLNLTDEELESKAREIQDRIDQHNVEIKPTILLDFRSNRASLEREIGRIDAEIAKNKAVLLDVKLDTPSLLRAKAEMTKRLSELPIWVKYNADEEGYKELLSKIDTLRREKVQLQVDVNMSDAELAQKAAEIRRKLYDLIKDRIIKIEIDRQSKNNVEQEMKELQRELDNMNIELEVHASGTELVAARLAILARDRIVTYFANVNRRSLAVAEGTLKSLAGLNVLHEATNQLEKLITRFDVVALKVSALATLLGNVANVGVYAITSMAKVGEGLLQIGQLALLGPTAFGAVASSLIVLQSVFKDFGAAAHGIDAALKRLPPSGQKAALIFRKLFADIREGTSKQFWDNASDPMLRFSETALPAFTAGLVDLGGRLGNTFGGILDSFTNLAAAGGLKTMFDNLSKMFENSAEGATALWDALNIIGLRGSEFLPKFGDWLTKISVRFKDWAETASANGNINMWITQGVAALKELWKLGGDAIDMFKGLAKASGMAGAGGLAIFQQNMRDVADRMNDPVWQARAANIFKGAREGASELNKGWHELTGTIGDSSEVFGNMLRLLGSIGGGMIANVGVVIGQDNFQKGATGALEGLDKMMRDLRPAAADLGNLIGNLDKIAGVAFSHLGVLLSTMVDLVDDAFGRVADGLADMTPRLMNTVESLFLAAAPAIIAAADAISALLDIINQIPDGFVLAGAAVIAFVALRALASKFFQSFSGTSYFQNLKSQWLQQQALAKATATQFRTVDGVMRRMTVPTQKFSATNAVFRDMRAGAGQVTGSLRAMHFMIQQTPQQMGRLSAALAAARGSMLGLGAATAGTSRLFGMFYNTARTTPIWLNRAGSSFMGPMVQTSAQLRMLNGQFTTTNSRVSAFQAAVRQTTPYVQRLGSTAGSTAGQMRGLYGQFRASTVQVGPLVAAMQTARHALGSTLVTAGRGILGVLGGGWGAAFMGAALAIGIFAQKQHEAKAAADTLAQSLDQVSGAITGVTKATITANIVKHTAGMLSAVGGQAKTASETLTKMGLKIEDVGRIVAEGGEPYDELIRLMEDGVAATIIAEEAWRKDGDAIEDTSGKLKRFLELTNTKPGDLAPKDMSGTLAFLQEQRRLIAGGQNEIFLKNDSMDPARKRVEGFNDAMRKFNDETGTAASRVSALRAALDKLAGKTLDLEDANLAVNESMDQLGWKMESVTEEINGELVTNIKRVGGAFYDAQGNVRDFTGVINSATGEINTHSAAGRDLYKGLKTHTENILATTVAMKDQKKPAQEIIDYVRGQRQAFIDMGVGAGLSAEVVAAAYDHMMNANPKTLETVITATGIEEAETKLRDYKGTLEEIDAYKAVASIAADDVVLGVKLADAYGSLGEWDKAVGEATADLDPTEADAVRERLNADLIELALSNPTVAAHMDPELFNRERDRLVLKIQELHKMEPSPKVTAETAIASARIAAIDAQLKALKDRQITVNTVYTSTDLRRDEAMANRMRPQEGANGGIVDMLGRALHGFGLQPVKAFANGGIERHIAQISKRGGPIRIWGEPETHGEAYIPLALSKRPRSVAILSKVAKEFGYNLNRASEFANGGTYGNTSTAPVQTSSTSVTVGTINTVDPEHAIRKLQTMQRDALAVAGII